MGCWRGYLSGVRCRLAYVPADATATHCGSGISEIQIGFTFLVPAQRAHPGSLGQRAVKRVCVCSLVISVRPIILISTGPIFTQCAGLAELLPYMKLFSRSLKGRLILSLVVQCSS